MGDLGLQQSTWASGSYGTFLPRNRNRKCKSCGFSNFSEVDLCFRCAHNPKNSQPSGMSRDKSPPTSASYESNMTLTAAPQVKQTGLLKLLKHVHSGSNASLEADPILANGLSTSRWAPRNGSRNTTADPHDIFWTRTLPQPKPNTYSDPSTIAFLDQELPYQVQHFILVMMQRILEEGCFDFAQRWIPEALHANRWDCPEAVELSKWRDFLPANLPPNAVKPQSNYTLNQALGHAVQTRNKAVHRHLCDNNQIKRMALQAQDLMYMFSDNSRSEKMHHLWMELNNWDARSRSDPHTARQQLETALQMITEKPVDDMDWTPNAISLQEVTSEAEGQIREEPYGEAMDLD